MSLIDRGGAVAIPGLSPFAKPNDPCGALNRRHTNAGIYSRNPLALGISKQVQLNTDEIKARRGDIVIFNFPHIDVCTADQDSGEVSTMEGNTALGAGSPERDREGVGVYERRRRKSPVRSLVRLSQRYAMEPSWGEPPLPGPLASNVVPPPKIPLVRSR